MKIIKAEPYKFKRIVLEEILDEERSMKFNTGEEIEIDEKEFNIIKNKKWFTQVKPVKPEKKDD